MKFQKIDSSGNHERFVMHIGREETKILIALLTHARQHTAKCDHTLKFLTQVRSMDRDLRKLIDL